MATLFQIVIGSTTLDVNGGNNTLLDYVPRPGDGMTPVTESASVLIVGSTHDNLGAAMNLIERVNLAAMRRGMIGAGDRAFIKFRPNVNTNTYRS